MSSLSILEAPYNSVQTKDLISDVINLLQMGETPSGTGSTSVIIAQVESTAANLLQLEGLGKELWHEIDAQEYINKLREEWER